MGIRKSLTASSVFTSIFKVWRGTSACSLTPFAWLIYASLVMTDAGLLSRMDRIAIREAVKAEATLIHSAELWHKVNSFASKRYIPSSLPTTSEAKPRFRYLHRPAFRLLHDQSGILSSSFTLRQRTHRPMRETFIRRSHRDVSSCCRWADSQRICDRQVSLPFWIGRLPRLIDCFADLLGHRVIMLNPNRQWASASM